MLISIARILLLISVALFCLPAAAQQLEKQHFHHNECTKGRFSEAVPPPGEVWTLNSMGFEGNG